MEPIDKNIPYITYVPNEAGGLEAPRKTKGTGLDQILTVDSTEPGRVAIQTRDGTYTLSAPHLEKPDKEKLSSEALGNVVGNLQNAEAKQPVDIYGVMALMHMALMQQRKTAKEQRNAMRDSQVQLLGEQADKMRDQALMGLVGGIVSGAVSAFGAIMEARSAFKSQGIANNLSRLEPNSAQFASLSKTADIALAKGRIWSSASGAMGQIAKGGFDYAGAMYGAEAKDKETEAVQYQTMADNENDRVRDLQSDLRDVRDKLAQMIKADADLKERILQI